MTSVDTNINDYTIGELLTILSLDGVDSEEIVKKTNQYIERFTKENNTDMIVFFQKMQP